MEEEEEEEEETGKGLRSSNAKHRRSPRLQNMEEEENKEEEKKFGTESNDERGYRENLHPIDADALWASSSTSSDSEFDCGECSSEEEGTAFREREEEKEKQVSRKKIPPKKNKKEKGNSSLFTQDNLGWKFMFNQLCIYKAKNGHCIVPSSHPENQSLAYW
eukprot:14111420-Ditylum_brightwellii.AAC.1